MWSLMPLAVEGVEGTAQQIRIKNDWKSFGKLTILIFARSIGFDGCNLKCTAVA